MHVYTTWQNYFSFRAFNVVCLYVKGEFLNKRTPVDCTSIGVGIPRFFFHLEHDSTQIYNFRMIE